jgi:RimJ/RimL family protein N-acetyltransferase
MKNNLKECGMAITLQKAALEDCAEIHALQIKAFAGLLEKYRDTATNPGAEPLERIVQRMEQPHTDYYFIRLNGENIGAIRIVRLVDAACRIAPAFLLPAYQNKGYAQQTIRLAEALYPAATRWELDTIKQEPKLCHLYEKMGYRQTGKEEELQPGMTIVFYEKRV